MAEEEALENERADSVPIPPKYRAYYVELQTQITPLDHGYPYDTTLELKFLASGAGRILVMPLLATDAVQESRESEVANVVREFGAQLQATAGLAGGGASLQKILASIESSQSLRPNSLYTIGLKDEETAYIRMGANNFGSSYEMTPGNHFISVVIFVPVAYVIDKNAGPLPEKDIQFTASFTYTDAMSISHGVKRYPMLGPIEYDGHFSIPMVPLASCPPPQDAMMVWSTLTQAVPGPGDVQSPATVGLVRLFGGAGFEWRTLTAALQTPVMAGQKLSLAAIDVRPIDGGLQLVFPDHSAGLVNAEKTPQIKFGSLTFDIEDSRDADQLDGGHCPKTGAYRVAYLLAPKPATPPPAATAKKATPDASAANASAAQPQGQATPPLPNVSLSDHVGPK